MRAHVVIGTLAVLAALVAPAGALTLDPLADDLTTRAEATALVPPGHALVVHADADAGTLALTTAPAARAVAPSEDGDEPPPNCLSVERIAWVQVDKALNVKGAAPVEDDRRVGSCRDWAFNGKGFQEVTFVAFDVEKSVVAAEDWEREETFRVECQAVGALRTERPGAAQTMTCVMERYGATALWTDWDALLFQSPATANGFAYALFE